MLSSRLSSGAGDEGVDDDPDDDADDGVEVVEAIYFRLLTTVGVPSEPPPVWWIGSFTGRPLTLAFLNGSGMTLGGFSAQHRESVTRMTRAR